MATETRSLHGPTCYSTGRVSSADGTEIGFREYGAGPALILVQGAIGTVQNYHDLASTLASDFSVYVPERRGRPLSPREYRPDHSINRDVEDLQALFALSGAPYLFGLSSGAVIALETARVLPGIQKLALFEAPLYVPPRTMRLDLVARLNREIEAGKIAAATVTSLIASGLAPRPITLLPRAFVEAAVAVFLHWNARGSSIGSVPLKDLVPSLRYDFNVVSSMQNRFDAFRTISCEVLLMHCAKSSAYLGESALYLDSILPRSHRVEFTDLDHSSPWNADQGGHPAVVAASLKSFFLSSDTRLG